MLDLRGEQYLEIQGQGGQDTITTTDTYDNVFGGDGDDIIHSGGGNDTLSGDAGNDHITYLGHEGALLHGGLGDDVMIGGSGDDRITDEGSGNDFIDGGAGNDVLGGVGGNDTILGGDGDDMLFGGEGTDIIDGGAGDDTVFAGTGSGLFQGGDGYDQLWFFHSEEYYDWSEAPEESGFEHQLVERHGEGRTILYGGFEKVSFRDVWGEVPCYARGTSILTVGGYRPVETLRAGDVVLTAFGEARPIRWTGSRHVRLTGHPKPHRVRPIRIRAGALAHGVPRRDLVVSPGHALLIDGRLMRAEHLANGATIVQEDRPEVEYFHIELPGHDILLAEGATAESYLDDGNRHMFSGEVMALHPDFSRRGKASPCIPFASAGEARSILARLRSRANALGWHLTDTPELHLLADGRRLMPLLASPHIYHFALPPGLSSLRLRSAAFRPRVMEPPSSDERVLGVALTELRLSARGTEHVIPPDHRRLSAGFHPAEQFGNRSWRWTDGDADLGPAVLPLLPRGGGRLTLHVRAAASAWTKLPAAEARGNRRAALS